MTVTNLLEEGKCVFELSKGRFHPFLYLLCISIFTLSMNESQEAGGKKMLLWIRDRGKGRWSAAFSELTPP